MNILKKPSEFKAVYAGKKFYTNAFSVHFITSSDTVSEPIFGFTISKKTVSKKAVIRNLVRRRLKEAVRLHFDTHEFLGYKIVFTAIKTTKNSLWEDYVDCVGYSARRIKKLSAIEVINKNHKN